MIPELDDIAIPLTHDWAHWLRHMSMDGLKVTIIRSIEVECRSNLFYIYNDVVFTVNQVPGIYFRSEFFEKGCADEGFVTRLLLYNIK